MTAPVEATVVIVNYNGAHLLPACLNALDQQRAAWPHFRTVVVDNASHDGSVGLLEREFPWVEVLASSRNRGFAGGNNLALKRVDTPYAVLLNNDAFPQPGWLPRLLAPFAAPGSDQLAMTTGKVLFATRFLPLRLRTNGFCPGAHDPRDLGVRVSRVAVDDHDVTEDVLWQAGAYGPEGFGAGRFRWTRPDCELLIPMPDASAAGLRPARSVTLVLAAEAAKSCTVETAGQVIEAAVTSDAQAVDVKVPADAMTVDVINNAGGIVLPDGSGADRGFQEIDRGQYDRPTEVFGACGNGLAIRTALGRELGWFDESFFMYYEDTDLSWRARARGWSIRYVPDAQLRHLHAATSNEWSPRWRFHVERNRLLMLLKNAMRRLAAQAVRAYAIDSLALVLQAVREGRKGRRPALRPLLWRARTIASFVRLAPLALVHRAQLRRRAVVSPEELEGWFQPRLSPQREPAPAPQPAEHPMHAQR